MPESFQSRVFYREMHGFVDLEQRPSPPDSDVVVLSNIHRGAGSSRPSKGLSIRFVGRGREDYRIAGRGSRLEEGQVMISAHQDGADVEIRQRERDGTSGLCVLLRGADEEAPWLFGPVVVPAECSALGTLMRDHARALRSSRRTGQLATQLTAGLRQAVPLVTQSLLDQSARIDAVKPSTRFEMVRRANLAQAYLHAVLGRAVDLDELGRAVGTSPFQLLRAFQHCFGETPASYHRKLRLQRAIDDAARRGVSICQVADDYGFAGASSFSHAYRRAFGHSPRQGSAARLQARQAGSVGC